MAKVSEIGNLCNAMRKYSATITLCAAITDDLMIGISWKWSIAVSILKLKAGLFLKVFWFKMADWVQHLLKTCFLYIFVREWHIDLKINMYVDCCGSNTDIQKSLQNRLFLRFSQNREFLGNFEQKFSFPKQRLVIPKTAWTFYSEYYTNKFFKITNFGN